MKDDATPAILPPGTIRRLDALARGGRPWQRFPDPHEAAFRLDLQQSAASVRLALTLIPVLVLSTLPLWALALLDASTAFALGVAWVDIGLVLPLGLAIAVLLVRRPQARSTEALFFAASLALIAVIEYNRQLAVRHGIAVSSGFAACALVGFIIVGRVRVVPAVAWMAGYVLMLLAFDVLGGEAGAQRRTIDWLMETVFLGVTLVGALFNEQYLRRAWAGRALLRSLALADPLTGLPNRRAFEDHYDIAAAQAQRENRTLFFAVIDVDHFKRINDDFGHHYGDGVLVEIGVVLGEFARRPLDLAARLGGEEFAMLLYDCDASAGRERLDALRAQIESLQLQARAGSNAPVTISAGGVAADPAQPASEPYHLADEALYRAKRGGRNRVVVDGS